MITLPQASKQTGKHEDTIRRLIKNLLKTDPQAKEKIKQEQTVRGFHYLIDEEYLLRHVQPLQTRNSKNSANNKTASNQPLRQGLNNVEHQPLKNSPQAMYQPTYAEVKAKDETIGILKKQLEEKDEQIKTLLERSRETNILLKGYQDKYLLEAPQKRKEEKTAPNTEVKSPDKTEEKPISPEKPAIKLKVKRKAARPKQKSVRQAKKPEKKAPQKKKGFLSFLIGK
jgi:sperm tail-like protein